jgi:hypothetical protein
MSEPLVFVILLGANADPSTDGLMASVRRALGPEAIVLTDTSNPQTDAEVLAIGERVRARALARVSWADDSRQVARLHVRVAPATEWEHDELRFLPQDAASEKGRTLGYTLASMVQRIEHKHADEPASAGTPPKPSLTASPSGADARSSSSTPNITPDVDVFAFGSSAIGGGATSLGGGGGVRWWPFSRVGLRGAAGARVGTIADADAATTTLFAAAGPSYRIPVGTMLELGARADFVLLQHSATRHRIPETTRARWLGAVDLLIEASWSLGPRAGLVAAAGTELAFGTTAVNVGGTPVADIPSVRALAELGARFRF